MASWPCMRCASSSCVPGYSACVAVGCLLALPHAQANWGPNATTFVIPAELFPTKWKSTGHGISAAAGKAGAIIGAFGFLFASQPALNGSIPTYACAFYCVVGSRTPSILHPP